MLNDVIILPAEYFLKKEYWIAQELVRRWDEYDNEELWTQFEKEFLRLMKGDIDINVLRKTKLIVLTLFNSSSVIVVKNHRVVDRHMHVGVFSQHRWEKLLNSYIQK